ncbi:hypothetical protein T484DRAFT_1817137 [Baffinella frigidus]|nr:hypothetical protein T484DRAFT_1817137 [Cryptophyta sp. CCMP2293]
MKCVLQRLNPKALRAREILGWSEDGTGTWHDGVLAAFWRRARAEDETGTWHDGVLAAFWRRARAEERTTRTWLCLDGPIDQRWVETLSGALDTGGSLTLSSEGMPPAAGLRVVLEHSNP